MSLISREDIIKVAALSKLKLNEEEIEKMETELNDILSYINILNEVDTSNFNQFLYNTENNNNFREDESRISIDKELVIKNAPLSEDGAIVVPKVVGEY